MVCSMLWWGNLAKSVLFPFLFFSKKPNHVNVANRLPLAPSNIQYENIASMYYLVLPEFMSH